MSNFGKKQNYLEYPIPPQYSTSYYPSAPTQDPVSTTSAPYVVQPVFMTTRRYNEKRKYQYRMEIKEIKHEKIAELLKQQFPNGFMIIVSILYILIGIAAIILESILIRGKGANFFVGAGIWGAGPCFLLASIFLLLSNKSIINTIFS